MTCKDCIHHDLCFDNGTLFLRYAKAMDIENAETKCPFKNFKNKADFVEVVRCKDCKFYENVEYYPEGTKDICRLFKRQLQPTDFCSYGERKDNGSSSNL